MTTYICTRCKEHCSVELKENWFWSNCCGQDLRGADGTILTLPELIRDICEEQRAACHDEIVEHEILRNTVFNAPLPEIEGLCLTPTPKGE